MIVYQCSPRHVFTWNTEIDGPGQHASLEFEILREQGDITCDGYTYRVEKHGMLSGHWTLEHHGELIATARKPSAMFRKFEIEDHTGFFDLHARSAFGRSYVLEREGREVASFAPNHPFTRKAKITVGAEEIEFTTLAFCHWLIVLTWRRAASNNSS